MESNDFVETSKKLQAAMVKKNRAEKRIEKMTPEEAATITIPLSMKKSIEKRIAIHNEKRKERIEKQNKELIVITSEIKELAAKIQEAIE